MIKMTAHGKDGRLLVILGLSHANLDKLKADGLKGFINVDGRGLDVPIDILITAGETEEELADYFKQFIGPATKVSDTR